MNGKTITVRVIVQMLAFVVVVPLLPVLVSRRWNWWEAWAYAAASIFGFFVSRIIASRKNPDLIAERARFMRHENTEPWDRRLAPLIGFGGALMPLAAGLDAAFSPVNDFNLTVKVTSLAVLLSGLAFSSWALVENRFFSGMVRIQSDRGHSVVSSGPYAVVRHPGYSGALLMYLAIPFLLDSWWTLLPVVLMTIVLVVRTRLEDRTLRERLDGYREYASRVRYRLLPGVW